MRLHDYAGLAKKLNVGLARKALYSFGTSEKFSMSCQYIHFQNSETNVLRSPEAFPIFNQIQTSENHLDE